MSLTNVPPNFLHDIVKALIFLEFIDYVANKINFMLLTKFNETSKTRLKKHPRARKGGKAFLTMFQHVFIFYE